MTRGVISHQRMTLRINSGSSAAHHGSKYYILKFIVFKITYVSLIIHKNDGCHFQNWTSHRIH
jgi:hypothetical protein